MDERQQTEALIARSLDVCYSMSTDVRTVVAGVNWTCSVGPATMPVAYARLYRTWGRSVSDIDAELAVLQAIRPSQTFNVARPLRSRYGALSVTLAFPEGARTLAVFEAAPGYPIMHHPGPYYAAGRALAELHGQHHLPPMSPTRRLIDHADFDQTIARIRRPWTHQQERMVRAVDRLRVLDGLTSHTHGFCHGDFHAGNLHLAGDRVVMFDFDECGLGPQWLDLATLGWWLEVTQPSGALPLWRAFLTGYGITAGNQEFFEALPWLITVQQIRTLRFLQDYCLLDDDLWGQKIEETVLLTERAAAHQLSVCVPW